MLVTVEFRLGHQTQVARHLFIILLYEKLSDESDIAFIICLPFFRYIAFIVFGLFFPFLFGLFRKFPYDIFTRSWISLHTCICICNQGFFVGQLQLQTLQAQECHTALFEIQDIGVSSDYRYNLGNKRTTSSVQSRATDLQQSNMSKSDMGVIENCKFVINMVG